MMNRTTALVIGYFIMMPIILALTFAYIIVMLCVSLIYLLEIIFRVKESNSGDYAQRFTYTYFTTLKDVFKDDDTKN